LQETHNESKTSKHGAIAVSHAAVCLWQVLRHKTLLLQLLLHGCSTTHAWGNMAACWLCCLLQATVQLGSLLIAAVAVTAAAAAAAGCCSACQQQ
jgi:hypothetical protein